MGKEIDARGARNLLGADVFREAEDLDTSRAQRVSGRASLQAKDDRLRKNGLEARRRPEVVTGYCGAPPRGSQQLARVLNPVRQGQRRSATSDSTSAKLVASGCT